MQQRKEERLARVAATADVAIVAIQKMEERLAAGYQREYRYPAADRSQFAVIGNLSRRAGWAQRRETSMLEESLERRFRLAALRSERGELYHLRATGRSVTDATKLLHDLILLRRW